MTGLEQAAVAFVVVLLIAVVTAAIRCGWVEGSLSVKVVPPWKRGTPQPKAPPREPEPAAEPPGDVPLREVS
jgi:hypothetical protein